jgi:uncharacterized protein YjbI with pentapeptide repeats
MLVCRAAEVTTSVRIFKSGSDQAIITWEMKSLVSNAPPILPDYYLQTSADLLTWTTLQTYRSNTAPRTISRAFTVSPGSNFFCRVQRLLDLSGRTFFRAVFLNADFRNARIIGADLFGANLTGSLLTEADLTGSDLRLALFSGANLQKASLFGANLLGANLRGADLRGADLSFTDLTRADLSAADLSFADLRFATLTDADLNFAFLRGVEMDEHTVIAAKWRTVAAILNHGTSGLNLKGMDLSFATFIGADLRNTDLSNADLRGGDFRLVNFSGANLMGANLNLAEFRFSLMDETTRVTNKWRTVLAPGQRAESSSRPSSNESDQRGAAPGHLDQSEFRCG